MSTRYGYFLSSEEHPPQELVRQARLAEEAGFGEMSRVKWQVWSVIGASRSPAAITTAVSEMKSGERGGGRLLPRGRHARVGRERSQEHSGTALASARTAGDAEEPCG